MPNPSEPLYSRDPQNEFGLEAGTMSRYKTTFEHIIPEVESELEKDRYRLNLSGEFEGTRFAVRFPHLRPGKHAVVGIVDLNSKDGETVSAVIRSEVESALSYSQMAAKYPLVEKLAPKLYGISGRWVVMERLVGLELEELDQRLREDPDFLKAYARNAFDVISSLANEGLKLNDVSFIDGHNDMVDPKDASIRIVEQDTFAPTIFTPNETITSELFDEFEHAKSEDWKADFAMQLLKATVEKIGAENLYIRSRVIKPTNPNYRDAYQWEYWKKLTDEQYEKILDDPVSREGLTVPWFGHGRTQAFSDPAINAAVEGDLKKFKALVSEGKHVTLITDKNDPRFGVIVLPDDFN